MSAEEVIYFANWQTFENSRFYSEIKVSWNDLNITLVDLIRLGDGGG
jgi:hypothetical protein